MTVNTFYNTFQKSVVTAKPNIILTFDLQIFGAGEEQFNNIHSDAFLLNSLSVDIF